MDRRGLAVRISTSPGLVLGLLVLLSTLHAGESLPSTHASMGENLVVVMTADTEGHVYACRSCENDLRLGGLQGRFEAVGDLRREHPQLLLLDTGNALFGADSLSSDGRVMVAAYELLGYHAVNVSYRDFYLGKRRVLELAESASFPFLSANLLDAATETLLFRPYIVKVVGDRRIGLIGVTQSPAGLAYLPHLQEQLAGTRIQSPVEALERFLPEVRRDADVVMLMVYGSPTLVLKLHERYENEVDVVLVGGSRPDELPLDRQPACVGTEEHGSHLTVVRLRPDATVAYKAIEPKPPGAGELAGLLEAYE